MHLVLVAIYRLNAIEAGLASQIEGLAMKEPKKS